jgi:hypothetical protein
LLSNPGAKDPVVLARARSEARVRDRLALDRDRLEARQRTLAGRQRDQAGVEGEGDFTVGEERGTAGEGMVVWAPSGIPHGVSNRGGSRRAARRHRTVRARLALVALIYCFTRTIVWAEYHEVKEGVLLHISAIIERHGAEIAFPTRLSDPLDR